MPSVATLVRQLRAQPDFAKAANNLLLENGYQDIRLLLDKADNLYYRPGLTPFMTDAEYDTIKQVFRNHFPADPILTRVGPPYSPEEIGNKAQHSIPMGSLDNTDDGILGFAPWLEWCQEKLGLTAPPRVMASLKVDGGSICASYKAGKLVRVTTRGNGEVGEDITANGVNFQGLPTVLRDFVDMEVRGEAVLYTKDYQDIRSREFGVLFDQIPEAERSNPRNIGNGIHGRHDGQDSDKIRFLAFNVVTPNGGFASEREKLDFLTDHGFQVVPHHLCMTPADFQNFYDTAVSGRDKLPFEIDGVVVVLDIIAHQDKFVTADVKTRLRPKYARAVKFPHKYNVTTLKDVTVTVGHTRMVIPTAVLEEVRIGGVQVTSALLNNYTEIQRLGVQIGDEVEVVLAGDIIPKVTRVVKPGAHRVPIQEPTECPACKSPTTRLMRGKEGACTYCSNPKCTAAVFAKLDQWIGTSKKGVGILDIGDSMIKALWENGMLADPADLYTLTVDGLKNVQIGKGVRIGTSRAEKIVKNIAAKKKLALHTFLGSLGIDLLGRRRVVLLREAAGGRLDRLENWLDTAAFKDLEIPGLGDTIRESVIKGIEENKPLITKLLANGVEIDYGVTASVSTDGEQPELLVEGQEVTAKPPLRPFAGFSFCFTGTRDGVDEVAKLGGVVKSGVSKGLTFLVQKDAESKSNKTQKAEEYGTKIISAAFLKRAINGEVTLTSMQQDVAALAPAEAGVS